MRVEVGFTKIIHILKCAKVTENFSRRFRGAPPPSPLQNVKIHKTEKKSTGMVLGALREPKHDIAQPKLL